MLTWEQASVCVRVWTFGEFAVERRTAENRWEAIPLEEWGGNTYSRRLLKVLLCHERSAHRGTLLAEIWPRNESMGMVEEYLSKAARNLRVVLHSEAQGELLKTIHQRTMYVLADQSRIWTDAQACEDLLHEAERVGRTSEEELALLHEAMGYFARGKFLEGEDGLWCLGTRGRLETAHYRCTLWMAEAYEAQGQLQRAEEQMRKLFEQDPSDEDALCRLMQLLHQQGMTHQALRLYQQTQRVLAQEGVFLSSATKALAAQLKDEPRPSRVASEQPSVTLPRGYEPFGVLPSLSLSAQNSADQKTDVAPSDEIMNRREAAKHLATLGLTLFTASTALGPLLESTTSFPLDNETLSSFEQLIEICQRLSQGNDLDMAERILWTCLPKVVSLALPPSQQQQAAARIASQGYLLAASLAGHHNDLKAREYLSEQALLFGNISQDRNLQIAALRQLAVTFDYLGRPDKVLQTYQQTFPYLQEISPLLCACVYAGVSGAYAQMQQKQEVYRFLGLAYEHFPEKPENQPDFLRITGNYSTLISWEGLNHLELGQPQESEKIFARVDGLQSQGKVPERVRIELLNYQAETFTAVGKLEQARSYVETAVKASLAIGSERRLRESFVVFQQMRGRWPNEQEICDLGDLFPQYLVNPLH